MEKSKPYPTSPTSVAFFIPILVLVLIGFIVGHIVQPLVSGFIAGRKSSKDFWHFDDLEKND